jgi:hypothetical protein
MANGSPLGLALNTNKDINHPLEIINSPQERARIASFLRPAFDKSEREWVSRQKSSPEPNAHYHSNAEMRKARLTISALRGSKELIDERRIYSVEARKNYKHGSSAAETSCDMISYFEGDVIQNKEGALKLIANHYDLSDCDAAFVSSSTSISVIAIRDRIFLIAEDYYDESGGDSIVELTGSKSEEILYAGGGHC